MITQDTIRRLSVRCQVPEYPNIVREYFQHLFLANLYRLDESDKVLFKGGTALRVIYGSPRFSEDLDFSVFGIEPYAVKRFIEDLFANVLVRMQAEGISVDLSSKSDETSGGYYGEASFQMYDYRPVKVSISVSTRNGRDVQPEVSAVANEFVPNYNVYHLPQEMLVDEKIDALLSRKKPRDFYDLYIIMRKGMLSLGQKSRLSDVKRALEEVEMNFRGELEVFLPKDQHQIIANFRKSLSAELDRQLAV